MHVLLSTLSAVLVTLPLAAQAAGLRGAAPEAPQVVRLPPPDATVAERLITIEAVAEVRVVPSRLRVVFAVSASAASSSAASAAGRALLGETRAKLVKAGIAETDLDTDFIAALPVYTWKVGTQDGEEALLEQRSGFRVQYNLHAAVPDEAAALAAIEAATTGDGVDVLAVDYWSDALAQKQVEAQQQALAAAQQKARMLLAVFPAAPVPVNVHEETRVLFPQQLYQTLPRVEDSASAWQARDRLPRLAAARPLTTYYRGLFGVIDAGNAAMPGKREIEILSTVRLYFAAPERPVLAVFATKADGTSAK